MQTNFYQLKPQIKTKAFKLTMRIQAIRMTWLLFLFTTDIDLIIDHYNEVLQTESTWEYFNSDMFNIIKESCPYQNWTYVARERCPNPDHFHCLIDEYGRIGWVCREPIWVEKGMSWRKLVLFVVLKIRFFSMNIKETNLTGHVQGKSSDCYCSLTDILIRSCICPTVVGLKYDDVLYVYSFAIHDNFFLHLRNK